MDINYSERISAEAGIENFSASVAIASRKLLRLVRNGGARDAGHVANEHTTFRARVTVCVLKMR